jgi:4'-phosphopantetheinyl transferase
MTSSNEMWLVPLSDLTLLEDEVHVWQASLEQPEATIQTLRQLLAADELAKAGRFHFEKDRKSFIVAHGLLRTLLGRYLHLQPGHLRFCVNDYGKPALDPSFHEQPLNFNMSHSHKLALYAFTFRRQVGIDVEYMRADVDFEGVARHSFSPVEQNVLHALLIEARKPAFYNCWTRKEAYIKARGMGLSLSLDLFDVSMKPGEPAALLTSREDAREAGRWRFEELLPGDGYAGALVVEGGGWQLRCFRAELFDKKLFFG